MYSCIYDRAAQVIHVIIDVIDVMVVDRTPRSGITDHCHLSVLQKPGEGSSKIVFTTLCTDFVLGNLCVVVRLLVDHIKVKLLPVWQVQGFQFLTLKLHLGSESQILL